MMFSPVPDKLSVMTYVFQIQTHFTRTQALAPSPLSLKKPTPRSRPAPPPPASVTSKDEPIDLADVDIACDSSINDNDSERKQQETEGYNPFLDDDVELKTVSEESTASDTGLSDAGQTSAYNIEKETVLDASNSSLENKNVLKTSQSKENDVSVNNVLKPPPKPPRVFQATESPSADAKVKSINLVDKKDKSESKSYNPFDEDESEDVVSDKQRTGSSSKLKTPQPGYNPFDDDNEEAGVLDSKTQIVNDKETKRAYNPFDEDDDDDDVTQTEKVEEDNMGKKEKGKRKVSYPHSFNPFEDDDDFKSSEIDQSMESNESKDTGSDKGTASKGYNPFDDDNDERASTDVSSTRKSRLEIKGKPGQVDRTERASPSPVSGGRMLFFASVTEVNLVCPP